MKSIFILGLVLLTSTVMYGQAANPVPSSTPITNLTSTNLVSQRLDSPAVVKAELKAYKAQLKAALALAKLQAKQQALQYKVQGDATKAQQDITTAKSKGN